MQKYSSASVTITEAQLKKTTDGYICEPLTLKDYQLLLGEIMHLMVKTRPDVAYFISQLAKLGSNLTEKYQKALKRILYYLEGTKNLGFCYTCAPGLLSFLTWTDAIWGKDLDDNCFTNRFVIPLASDPVAYKSQKQQSIMLSKIEVEYIE